MLRADFLDFNKMRTLPYNEGSWFAIPLRKGGFSPGIVVRMAPRGNIILIYLFSKKYNSLPKLWEVEKLKPTDAVKFLRAGDLGLIDGSWKILGVASNFDRAEWPIPVFEKKEPLSGESSFEEYSDDNPSKLLYVHKYGIFDFISQDSGLFGAGAVEIIITKINS